MPNRTVLVAVALSSFALGSALAQTSTTTIAGIVSKDPQFSTLLTALKAAGLDKTLAGTGPFTVFAPINAAFAKIPKATLTALLKNKAQLTKVLTYHVVAGGRMDDTLSRVKSIRTLEGSSVRISAVGQQLTMVDRAKVTKSDIPASNGVIHVIDTVLMPAK